MRSSERRRLRERIREGYKVEFEGSMVAKVGQESVYIQDRDPLWFTDEGDIVPSLYTLWITQDLLPSISTPESVISILIGGAHLMVPGGGVLFITTRNHDVLTSTVINPPPHLKRGQLVSISTVNGPPLAVGRMAVDIDTMPTSGKAVHVLHTWKDALFNHGSRPDPPVPTETVEPEPEPEPEPESAPESDPLPALSAQGACSPPTPCLDRRTTRH
jgi:translation initiation factor 2D